MTSLKEQISDYLPILKKKLKEEKDKKIRRYLRIKISEITKLRDEL